MSSASQPVMVEMSFESDEDFPDDLGGHNILCTSDESDESDASGRQSPVSGPSKGPSVRRVSRSLDSSLRHDSSSVVNVDHLRTPRASFDGATGLLVPPRSRSPSAGAPQSTKALVKALRKIVKPRAQGSSDVGSPAVSPERDKLRRRSKANADDQRLVTRSLSPRYAGS